MKKLSVIIASLALGTIVARAATTVDAVAVRVPIPSIKIASQLVTGLGQSTNAFAATDVAVSNLVNLTTTQTVAGVKTFIGQLISSNGIYGGTVYRLTNGTFFGPTLSNGVNVGAAFSSHGSGLNSEQFGSNAVASGIASYAGGQAAEATNEVTTATGSHAHAYGYYASAYGGYSAATGEASGAWGAFSQATKTNSYAIGFQSIATNNDAMAVGSHARTTEDNQVVLGSSNSIVVVAGRLVDSAISNATFSGAIVLLTSGIVSNTTVTGSTVTNATVKNGTITNAAISGGTLAGAAVSNGTITNASILGGTVTNAAMQGGTIAGVTSLSGTVGNVTNGTWRGGTFAGTNQFTGILALNKWDNTSLATGPNADVNIGTNSFVKFASGPGAAYSISGLAAGVNGQVVTLYFPLSYAVTILNDTGTAANRILTLAGGDVTSSGACSTTLIYDSSAAKWIMVSFWRDTGQQVYGTNVVGAVAWSGNATNALGFTGQANSATITASETSTTTNIVQRSITGSIAGVTLRLWNDTQGKYQQITLSGGVGAEHLTVTDIP